MISKTKIGITLALAMVASAALYAGIAHTRHQAVSAAVQPQVQTPQIPKPAAGTPIDQPAALDQARTVNDPNATQQPTNSADDSNQAAGADQADAEYTDQGQSTAAPARQSAGYAAAPLRRIAPVRAVHVLRTAAPATPVAVTHLDPLVAPVARVVPSAIVVPAGTPLTLRLDEPLGSKISQVDQSFSATLDRDVEVDGHRLIASGAHVTGKVLLARPAGRIAGEATLQLAVTSVKVHNRELDVLTSARSFGPTINGKNKVGRFIKGIGKRLDGEEREVLLAEQTAYTFNLSSPLEIR